MTPTLGLFQPRVLQASIAAIALAFAGCANQGFKVVSVTYQWTDQNRLAREWRALLDAQDQCYFAGFSYAQAAGPPQIVSDIGPTGDHLAMRSFYCIGLRGGDGG